MTKTAGAVDPFSLKSVLSVSLLSIAYLVLSYFLVGFKSDQVTLVFLFNLFYYLHPVSRKFIIGFSIFIIYWIVYDYMKAFPNYNYNAVHIADLYNCEKRLFGINYNGALLTPNEYWRFNGHPVLDVLTGIFYLCWIPVPMAFAVYLFFVNRRQFICFLLTFFLVNLLGFIVYYAYPAAPPWYVQYHGFDFVKLTQGNTAGLAKFDKLFNANIFSSIYAKGSNVFAAMPSLHSSYPLIVLYYGIKNKLGTVNIFFATVMVGIWFAAVYTSHHYILDVAFGIVCAIVGIALFELVSSRIKLFKTAIDRYEAFIK
ncbi:inositol phosphorylceramide synthase [Mucilaginibacter hurinus]|uniref:Inositol phosphorylceramide synthase n=1 Tax=Mucilaginibacter hurinus TaxID=2201324 RepID=A0A367GT88_9SPHI|nr:phosphatase PAP2 family protein [Mucilaginibacter hurinus]RCH56011.1 inositol phosphorylceramide synthase [Mucilaginibacter hurinus]